MTLSNKPDIDERSWRLGYDVAMKDAAQTIKALYHRLAAEAVDAYWDDKAEEFVKALPIDKLKAIMEIKES